MPDTLQPELETYERRTPASRAAHAKAANRLPLGVASNYRSYRALPLHVRDGQGSRIHDIDGNEYIDFNMCFGALMAGHCHPAVMHGCCGEAQDRDHVRDAARHGERAGRGDLRALSGGHGAFQQQRHRMHHARVRLARAATGRERVIKMEGGYHGLHDSALVSVKPKANRSAIRRADLRARW